LVVDGKKWKDIVRQALQPTVGCSANGRRRRRSIGKSARSCSPESGWLASLILKLCIRAKRNCRAVGKDVLTKRRIPAVPAIEERSFYPLAVIVKT